MMVAPPIRSHPSLSARAPRCPRPRPPAARRLRDGERRTRRCDHASVGVQAWFHGGVPGKSPIAGWFTMENPMQMDDLEPQFQETYTISDCRP